MFTTRNWHIKCGLPDEDDDNIIEALRMFQGLDLYITSGVVRKIEYEDFVEVDYVVIEDTPKLPSGDRE